MNYELHECNELLLRNLDASVRMDTNCSRNIIRNNLQPWLLNSSGIFV